MSIKRNQDKFNFFIPLDFVKGTDSTGKELTKIKGVCSVAQEDKDQQILLPSGYDFSPLLEKGYLNWNHQAGSTAKAICGEPTFARVQNNGKEFYIEGVLYDNAEGRAVAELAHTLEKNSQTRRLGFSIEGQSLEKDAFNPKIITKARITGVAICTQPKCPNTLLQLVKGEYETPFIEDEEKDEEETEKAIDTAAISPATPESVEHSKNSNKKNTNFTEKLISKSEVFLSIAQRFPTASIAETQQIHSLIQEVNTKLFSMENTTGAVYSEAIQKAFDLINDAQSLIKGETKEEVIKSSDPEIADEAEVEKAMGTASVLFKAGMKKEDACDTMCKGGIPMLACQGAWEKVASAFEAQKQGGDISTVTAPIVKSEETTLLTTEPLINIADEIKKSLAPISDIITKGFEGFKKLGEALQEENTILKSELYELKEWAKQPTPIKSITATSAAVVDRFQKSETATQIPAGCEAYNVNSQEDLNRLRDRLTGVIIEKGENADPILEGVVNNIEFSKTVPQFAYSKLRAMNIILTKG